MVFVLRLWGKTGNGQIGVNTIMLSVASPGRANNSRILDHRFTFRSRSAFPITDTELKVIATAAIMGLNKRPNRG